MYLKKTYKKNHVFGNYNTVLLNLIEFIWKETPKISKKKKIKQYIYGNQTIEVPGL